ncbi:MAG TPA: pyridoxamine 5'-phosphate oxidase [Chitinophagaceae bacterium]|nr:pyridoxamine 5'-phosphate oxidase [Chitinophagaceae bacterium]
MSTTIADIRKEYKLKSLSEADAHPNAIDQFTRWWQEALKSDIDEVNAMTLATASSDGLPSARIVLLKGYDANGFIFYTNYYSFKGQQLTENPRGCLVLFWKELERQIRITGLVAKTPATESDAYFNIRPEGSRLGAIASPQSQVIANREWLETEVEHLKKEVSSNRIVRPAHWGGYRLMPTIIEFWQGRPNRLHDRIQYTLQDDATWKIERLAP